MIKLENMYPIVNISVAFPTDNPPSDQMPKIKGVICSEFEKHTRGHPYYFSKFESLEKKTRGDPYFVFSKFE